jgi:hypothetical protein
MRIMVTVLDRPFCRIIDLRREMSSIICLGLNEFYRALIEPMEPRALHLRSRANVSRATAIALRWTGQYAQAPGPGIREWDAELAEAADQAIAVGNNYSHFEVCFQGFHKNLYAAEIVAPSRVRFTGDTTPRYRQVRAFQQYASLRPPPVGVAQPLAQVETPRVRRLMEATVQGCRRVSPLQFEYDDAWELWREMFSRNHERVRGLTRRAGDLTLGPFTLDEFSAVYAAIVTVVSAHDFLSFCWGESFRVYPLESAVS